MDPSSGDFNEGNHVDEQLVLADWNYRMTRARADKWRSLALPCIVTIKGVTWHHIRRGDNAPGH